MITIVKVSKYQCVRCDKSFDNEGSLRKHVGRQHHISSKEFYVEFKLDDVEPTCACGCGSAVKYNDWTRGFSKFARGHQSRVCNAMLGRRHTEESKQKMSTSSRGSIAWNKGLTKETDERLARQGHTFSKRVTSEMRRARSNKMKSLWINRDIVPLRGADHSQWKGGTSSIRTRVDAQQRMWTDWKDPIKERAGHRCESCGIASRSLDVHHDCEKMADIVNRFVGELNPDKRELSWEEEHQIVEAIIDYHIKENVSGQALCRDCHSAIHNNLNF